MPTSACINKTFFNTPTRFNPGIIPHQYIVGPSQVQRFWLFATLGLVIILYCCRWAKKYYSYYNWYNYGCRDQQ